MIILPALLQTGGVEVKRDLLDEVVHSIFGNLKFQHVIVPTLRAAHSFFHSNRFFPKLPISTVYAKGNIFNPCKKGLTLHSHLEYDKVKLDEMLIEGRLREWVLNLVGNTRILLLILYVGSKW